MVLSLGYWVCVWGGVLPVFFFFSFSLFCMKFGSLFLSVVAPSLPTSLGGLTLLPLCGFPQPQHPLPSSVVEAINSFSPIT